MSEVPVSVVVPAHDAAATLGASLASVGAQEPQVAEVIVVDDGSTDATPQIAASAGARVLRQSNGGPAVARNAGLEAASGDIVMFLDADDLWPRGTVAHRLARLASAPDVELLVGSFAVVGGAVTDPGRVGDHHAAEWWTFLFGAATVRAETIDRVGPLDASLVHGEDLDWYLRARGAGVRIERDDVVTLLYRRAPGSLTDRQRAAQRSGIFDAIRRHGRQAEVGS